MELTSTPVTTFAPKILSGIDVIDKEWGGLYRGGSYLVYGRAASGRGLLTLMFIQTGALLGESCLIISPERPKDLMIQAASIGFDLQKAHREGTVRMMRIPPLFNLQSVGDDSVAQALRDLVEIIRRHQPKRLVVNDFTPFVLFRSFDRLRAEFIQMLEQIDPLDTTMMLAVAEPASRRSEEVVDFMKSQLTASIHLEMVPNGDLSTKRRLTLIPHIGHLKRKVVDNWDLESLVASSEALASSLRMLPAQEEEARPAPQIAPKPAPPVTPPTPEPEQPASPVSRATDLVEHLDIFVTPPSPQEPTTPPVTPPTPEPEPEKSHAMTDRAAFRELLQQHFLERDLNDTPFLLLAMRMDRTNQKTVRPFEFEFILDLVSESLREQDAMLADMEHERLVVLLANSRPEEAQNFFSQLKNRLRQDTPQQADHLLHSVSAIVVPDGRPFQTAEEFLSYALDEV